jgi:hypothetical protein
LRRAQRSVFEPARLSSLPSASSLPLADLTTKRRFVLKEEKKKKKKYVARKKREEEKKDRIDNVARYSVNVLRIYSYT